MKPLKLVAGFLAAAIALGIGAGAQAARAGVFVGPGYYWGPPAPVYYYPPPVVVPVVPEPQEYIERGQGGPVPAPGPDGTMPRQDAGTWYYCDASKTYYPYVKECASDWRAVPAQPPANE